VITSTVVLENQQVGNPVSEWGIFGSVEGVGSRNIEGFTTDISVNAGQRLDFKIDTDSTHYRIDIYLLGYYDGMGARKVASIDRDLATPQHQPNPLKDPSTGLIDAGNWSVSGSWDVPPTAVSGVYIAKLVREDGIAGENHIPFVVRNDGRSSDIVFQTSDTTWQAYNDWGGASFYSTPRASAISYNRPFTSTFPNSLLGPEFAAIQWLERNGYDVAYISGVDTARNGAALLNHEVFLSVGHDEYWSGEQRANVENARDAGVNLAFWSGNEVYWKTRWEPSIAADTANFRTLITYKESLTGAPSDPSSVWTGLWRDPRSGAELENALTGTIFMVNGFRRDTIAVSDDYAQLRFWRNTDIATLQDGQTISLAPGSLGHEWDISPDNGFRPDGLINLSSTTLTVDTLKLGFEKTGTGTATHNLTLYRAPSGALVFGAGSVFWSFGLSSNHAGGGPPEDRNVQQAMVNLFADMGVQPSTLQASLVGAAASQDHSVPTSSVEGSAFHPVDDLVVVTGAATDFGGGVVAGVEVSTDSGRTWHPAAGTSSWAYAWTPTIAGTLTIMSRAVDDSLNLGLPSVTLQLAVAGSGADTLMGMQGADRLHGMGGADIIIGDGGGDALMGGTGSDRVDGGSGDDLLFGGAGNDVLLGGPGSDRLEGHKGADVLTGGSGNDALNGDAPQNPQWPDAFLAWTGSWTGAGSGAHGWYLGDFNGDGRDDIFRRVAGQSAADMFLSSGSSFVHDRSWTGAESGVERWYVGDFNGDGRDDIFRYLSGKSGADMFLSNGSRFVYAGSWTGAGSGIQRWYVGDFNGDGRDDIFRYLPGESGARVLVSTGTGFIDAGSWTTAGYGTDRRWYVGDFNGDGRDDIARQLGGQGLEVFVSTGSSFDRTKIWAPVGSGAVGWQVGDFNGDGRADVTRFMPGQSGANVFLARDGRFEQSGSWTGAGNGSAGWHIGNFDGQGGDDIFRYLVGVSGADVFLSESNGDTFVFGPNFGHDTITAFRPNDVLKFERSVIADGAALAALTQQVGPDTIIAVDGSNSVTLLGVNATTLQAHNYEFF
jgi:hypothetical protein